ncbi:hypothetical protein EVAR_16303_1 [Eumeta japonica]|uniref:Uncharacterized protein n=1 Tax=Eumeta variegata TaxID=151549 RepID=A0A4C1VE41_EUMVA|nr:hypothetical protein EVAR_16303_1 [Eumeta japonica]
MAGSCLFGRGRRTDAVKMSRYTQFYISQTCESRGPRRGRAANVLRVPTAQLTASELPKAVIRSRFCIRLPRRAIPITVLVAFKTSAANAYVNIMRRQTSTERHV